MRAKDSLDIGYSLTSARYRRTFTGHCGRLWQGFKAARSNFCRGTIRIGDIDLTQLEGKARRDQRRRIQMIFAAVPGQQRPASLSA
jgi:hypothetical protein